MGVKNKNICILMPGWIHKHSGGAEIQMFYITNELIRRGWSVEVVTSYKENILNENFVNSDIKFHYYKSSRFIVLSIFKAFRVLKKTSSKYYYLRTDAKILRTALHLLKKIRKIKTVYALALDLDAENKSFLSQSVSKNIFKRLDALVADIFDIKSINGFDEVICQTRQQQRILLDRTGIKGEVIYNSFIDTIEQKKFDKENLIIWVGNMRKQKNPEALFRIINRLDLMNWKLCVIGRKKEYLDQIDAINKKGVVFLGELTHKETSEYFKRAKVLLNTSYVEGFSNTFIQAWYYKVWLISLVVDPDSIIQEYSYGDVYNNNIEFLINKLKSLILGNEFISDDLIFKAKEFVEEKFDLVRNVSALEEILNNV